MSTPSLERRLLTYIATGAILVIVVGGVVVDQIVWHRMRSTFDRALESKARAIMSLTTHHPNGIELEFADEFMPEYADDEDPHYFELRLGDGTLIERSESFKLVEAGAAAGLGWSEAPSSRLRLSDVTLPDGRRGRTVQIDFVPQLVDAEGEDDEPIVYGEDDEDEDDPDEEDESGWVGAGVTIPPGRVLVSLVVARERESLGARHLLLRGVMVAVALLLLAVVFVLTPLALKLGLRPLSELATQAEQLDISSLHVRLGARDVPQELAPFVGQVNALLDRLEASFLAQKQLTSDLAHDLKTPVTELRVLCEVALRWPDDREAIARFFKDAQSLAFGMERMIQRLLLLSREDGVVSYDWSSLDLVELVRETWAVHARRAEARGLVLEDAMPPSAIVHTDREQALQVISNVIANAVDHAAEGTAVRLQLDVDGVRACLTVSNVSTDLTPDDLESMFERFWRKDASRTSGEHLGLGLALVRAGSRRLGIDVQAGLAQGVFSLRLGFPRTKQSPIASASATAG